MLWRLSEGKKFMTVHCSTEQMLNDWDLGRGQWVLCKYTQCLMWPCHSAPPESQGFAACQYWTWLSFWFVLVRPIGVKYQIVRGRNFWIPKFQWKLEAFFEHFLGTLLLYIFLFFSTFSTIYLTIKWFQWIALGLWVEKSAKAFCKLFFFYYAISTSTKTNKTHVLTDHQLIVGIFQWFPLAKATMGKDWQICEPDPSRRDCQK